MYPPTPCGRAMHSSAPRPVPRLPTIRGRGREGGTPARGLNVPRFHCQGIARHCARPPSGPGACPYEAPTQEPAGGGGKNTGRHEGKGGFLPPPPLIARTPTQAKTPSEAFPSQLQLGKFTSSFISLTGRASHAAPRLPELAGYLSAYPVCPRPQFPLGPEVRAQERAPSLRPPGQVQVYGAAHARMGGRVFSDAGSLFRQTPVR